MSDLLCAVLGRVSTPANCCPVPSCSIDLQTKSGDATLCGISEFTTPSTPPKRYRRKAVSGDHTSLTFWEATNCDTPFLSSVSIWDAECQYNPSNCALSSENNSTLEENGSPPTALDYNCAAGALGGVLTPTTATDMNGDGSCTPYGGFVGGDYRATKRSGTRTEVLSEEDTEDDAIARANADIADWTACVPSSCPDCSAFKPLRGAGVFSLAYRALQVRVVSSGGTQGTIYNTAINLQRRLQGTSDPFIDWIEINHQFVGTVDGLYTGPWLSVPVSSGYEVCATGCSIAIG